MSDQAAPKSEITIRPANLEDVPFIFSSWLKSYRDAPAVRGVPNSIYYARQHDLITAVFARKNVRVYIACAPDEPSQIFGYLVGEALDSGPVLHFLYVKHPMRNFGVGKYLESHLLSVVPGQLTYTQAGKNHERLLKNREYIYNPYLIWSK